MAESAKTGSREFGDLLRVARERRGISRRELAEATNLSYPYISQLETGYRQPSPGAIRNLADVLELSLDEIFAAIGPRADEPAPREQPNTEAGWIPNKAYGAQAAQGVQPDRLAGGGPPRQQLPAQSPDSAVAQARAGAVARAAAPMSPAPMSPAPIPAAPMRAAPTFAASSLHPTAASAENPQNTNAPAPLASVVVDQAVDLLSALPLADRLAALSQIQQKVIDAVVDERVQLRERH